MLELLVLFTEQVIQDWLKSIKLLLKSKNCSTAPEYFNLETYILKIKIDFESVDFYDFGIR